MAVMETLHNTVPEESRIYVVFVLVILWDVRLNVGAKLIDGDASVMTVCIVYGVLWQVSKMVSAFVEVGIIIKIEEKLRPFQVLCKRLKLI